MQIEYRTGDLTQTDIPCLIHGCNAQGRMGSGVAKAIRAAFPRAYMAYRDAYDRGTLTLGAVIWALDGHHLIGNAVTQQFYGSDGTRYVDYEAIWTAMASIDKMLDAIIRGRTVFPGLGHCDKVAFPLIGAGLGGGDWSIIAQIIESESRCFTPVVYTLDGVVPGLTGGESGIPA